jgi:hypothetical protein
MLFELTALSHSAEALRLRNHEADLAASQLAAIRRGGAFTDRCAAAGRKLADSAAQTVANAAPVQTPSPAVAGR